MSNPVGMDVYGFASKVMGHIRYGFAAGVGFAAVAVPRRNRADYFRGLRPRMGFALGFIGPKARTKGSPKTVKVHLRRGAATAAKPTPAAKPKLHQRPTFRAKPMFIDGWHEK